jgi:hypothetical protein
MNGSKLIKTADVNTPRKFAILGKFLLDGFPTGV